MAPRVAGDVSELAAGEVEAAIVATNIASHSWISLPLLTSGIHVFVEKLMATSLAEARAMVETATANSVCLAVGHMCRFLFVNRWVKALIDSGVMGEITGFDVREGTNYHLPTGGRLAAVRAAAGTGPYSPTFWDAKSAGGGVLLDIGSHTLDILLWWLGKEQLVSYRADSLGSVECEALLEIELRNGAVGTVELSRSRSLAMRRSSPVAAGQSRWRCTATP